MAAGLTITATKNKEGATANLTGGPATAGVLFSISMPGGGILSMTRTTDGTGAASVSFVPNSPGTVSVTITQPNPSSAVVGPITAQVY